MAAGTGRNARKGVAETKWKGKQKMKIEEAIRKYGIEPVDYGPNKGKVLIRNMPKASSEKGSLMKQVPEIKEYFKVKKAKAEAERARREANVASIPGLKEIV